MAVAVAVALLFLFASEGSSRGRTRQGKCAISTEIKAGRRQKILHLAVTMSGNRRMCSRVSGRSLAGVGDNIWENYSQIGAAN